MPTTPTCQSDQPQTFTKTFSNVTTTALVRLLNSALGGWYKVVSARRQDEAATRYEILVEVESQTALEDFERQLVDVSRCSSRPAKDAK